MRARTWRKRAARDLSPGVLTEVRYRLASKATGENVTTLRGAMVGITTRIRPAALIGRMQGMRLREKASLQVLLLAAVIGGLVTFILVLQHVDRQAAAAAQSERAAQLSLDRYSLSLAGQGLDVEDYLLTRDPGLLDSYRASRQSGAQ